MLAKQPATDGRRIRGEESRKAIIMAAVACIAAHGLRHTTLDRVARMAGVSRALVVFHFKSKNRMLTHVLNHLGAIYSAGWDAILSADDPDTAGKILRLVDYDVGFAKDRPDFLSVWYAFWGEANGSTLYRDVSFPRDERYARDLRRLLERLIEEGAYDDMDAAAIETGIFAMMFGLWLRVHLNPRPDDYERGMRALTIFLGRVFPRHFD